MSSASALPYYARPAEAWEEESEFPDTFGAFFHFYTVPGRWFEIVLAMSFSLTTDATAGNRTATVEIRDVRGIPFISVPAILQTPPSSVSGFSYLSDISVVTPASFKSQVVAFPGIAFPPGSQFFIDTPGGSVGDQYTSFNMYSRRIPTGAIEDTIQPAAQPSLLT